jgi:type II secretory pathway pseudopilin PulG
MLVVVVIVIIALTLVLPSARTMWDQRKVSDAENIIRGLLMTARANALRASGVESGLLFYVDRNGTQRVVSIEQDEQGKSDCIRTCYEDGLGDCEVSCGATWENVFRVTEDRQQRLPKPMRAVPRYVIDSGGVGIDDTEVFSDQELANNLFGPASGNPVEFDEAQRHRNYFTMVYSSDGGLLIRRDVLIRDDDLDNNGEGDTYGDLAGMLVGYDRPGKEPNVTQYYSQDDNQPVPIDTRAGAKVSQRRAVPFLVVDGQNVAVNFPTVDGLLVYDDSSFNGFADEEEKRDFLLRTALPFYISRMSGAVIRGPRGEVEE